MKHQQIRYTPGPQVEVTARVTSASQNFESGGCPVYLGSDRVDCTLDEIDTELGVSLRAALQRLCARKRGGVVEDAPEPKAPVVKEKSEPKPEPLIAGETRARAERRQANKRKTEPETPDDE